MIHQHVPAKSITCLEISKLGPVVVCTKTQVGYLKKNMQVLLELFNCILVTVDRIFSTVPALALMTSIYTWADVTEPPTCNSTSEMGHEGHDRWNTNSELISSGWHTHLKQGTEPWNPETQGKRWKLCIFFGRCFSLLKRWIFHGYVSLILIIEASLQCVSWEYSLITQQGCWFSRCQQSYIIASPVSGPVDLLSGHYDINATSWKIFQYTPEILKLNMDTYIWCMLACIYIHRNCICKHKSNSIIVNLSNDPPYMASSS